DNAAGLMTEAEAHPEQRHQIVLAEIDRPEGFAIAERAMHLPQTSLWLASAQDPLALAREFSGDMAPRFKAILEKADGWTRCDHLVESSVGKAQAVEIQTEIPSKAAALRSVT